VPLAETSAAGWDPASFYHPFRADQLGIIAGEVPGQIEVLPPRGQDSWPGPLREEVARRIRQEWGAAQPYGALRYGVGLWLSYPLVTATRDGRVLVPVIESTALPIRGSLALPPDTGPRRTIVLLDASSSANTPTLFHAPSGAAERISVLEAERRAVAHLIDALDPARVDLGVIAFGESTWPVVEPGSTVEQARQRLAEDRAEHPRGDGRTDTVCALWLAREWLDETPDGMGREIVLLTDGDLPHSGRFLDCGFTRRRGDGQAADSCEARRNPSPCPAAHRFSASDGASDLVQLASFTRRARRKFAVHSLVFEEGRPARAFHELSLRTGGEFARVPSADAVEAALPALVVRRIRGVFARNARTGHETGDLYDIASRSFRGELPLAPGANDVELRVESDRGTASFVRLRIYSEGGLLERYLADLRAGNRELEARLEERETQPAPTRAASERRLELEPQAPPASAAP
jgi:hypothetical protein